MFSLCNNIKYCSFCFFINVKFFKVTFLFSVLFFRSVFLYVVCFAQWSRVAVVVVMVPTVMESDGKSWNFSKSWKVMENGESHGTVMEF